MKNGFIHATLVTLGAAFLQVTPVSAQRGIGMPADTTGAGGAPSLRALVQAGRSESDLRVVLQRFNADRAALGRRYDIPLSPVLHARQRAFYDGWERRLGDVDAAALNEAGRADLATLRERIAAGVAAVEEEERARTAVTPLLPFLREVQQLQERRRDRLGIAPMETAQTIADVLKDVRRLTAMVEKSATGGVPAELSGVSAESALRAAALIAPPDSTAAGRGGRPPAAGPLRVMLDDWFGYFNGYDPLFSWWVHKPYEELSAALNAYSKAIAQRWRPAT